MSLYFKYVLDTIRYNKNSRPVTVHLACLHAEIWQNQKGEKAPSAANGHYLLHDQSHIEMYHVHKIP